LDVGVLAEEEALGAVAALAVAEQGADNFFCLANSGIP
jgi:hypothetical protein